MSAHKELVAPFYSSSSSFVSNGFCISRLGSVVHPAESMSHRGVSGFCVSLSSDNTYFSLSDPFTWCSFEIISIIVSCGSSDPGVDPLTGEMVSSPSVPHVPIVQSTGWRSATTENVCCHQLWRNSFLSYERSSYPGHLRSEGISKKSFV